MKKPVRWFLCLITAMAVLLCCSSTKAVETSPIQEIATREKYGQNIIYYDFSKIPLDSLILDEEISFPNDLKNFLNDEFNNPKIQDPQRFEELFWKEADKLGFTADKFKEMNIYQAIKAVVKIVGARITYHDVDGDTNFTKTYGQHLPIDVYFELGLGDCDKYRGATLAAFKIIKPLNPRLRNVYLSTEELGGNTQFHAWVSVVIPQQDRLIVSHIDPTFSDNGGALEADDFHITLQNNFFLARFYRKLSGWENQVYIYQIFENGLPAVKSDGELEEILDEMSFVVLIIAISKPELAVEKILPVIQLYETKGFTFTLDALLYRACEIYSRAGNTSEAEKYKQRLLTEFPNSYWSKFITKKD